MKKALTVLLVLLFLTAFQNMNYSPIPDMPEGEVIVFPAFITEGPIEGIWTGITPAGDTIIVPIKVTCDMQLKRT